MRAFPDTNAEILQLLPIWEVASVRGQQYEGGTAWHVVQYNGMWGFIREDQMRMLGEEETRAYVESLMQGTPTPSPAPTPEPISQNSLSSYGYVQSTSGRVNLRSAPSTDSNRIRLLDNYAFALVLGTVNNGSETWYHVSQAGTEGYILGDYFKVLTLGELTTFLQSNEYLNANSNNTANTGTSSQIQPVEDYNQTVWKNPALTASYEPFNPYVTPTPDPERLPTATPTPSPPPTPTASIAPIGPLGGVTTPQPATTQQGGSAWPWVLLALAAVGGGGAYYAYTIHRQNERRRQAVRAQQARQARAAAQQPQMRAAQNNPNPRSPYSAAAPFMPPQGGAPRPAQPGSAFQSTGRVSQNTNPYRPISARTNGAYTAAPAPARPDAGETQAFQPQRPIQTNGESLRQETRAYQPIQPESASAALERQETRAYQPIQPESASASLERQETRAYQPIQSASAASAPRMEQAGEASSSASRPRQRRSDRYRNQEPGDEA